VFLARCAAKANDYAVPPLVFEKDHMGLVLIVVDLGNERQIVLR